MRCAILFVTAAYVMFASCALAGPDALTLYCGRSEGLVQPILQRFTEQTGIEVKTKYGKTAPLTLMLTEEGGRSPADVFWAQDAGALGAVATAGLFDKLPDSIIQLVPQRFENPQGYWVATSGRARVLAYSPQRIGDDALPRSVFDLTNDNFRGRVGWAPANASFQAFVTAMRRTVGEDETRQWLEDMKANGAKAYPKNTAIIQAIAAGEIDYGLPNHYYLLRFKATDPEYPVEQTAFAPGDIGNLINVAGVGVLAASQNKDAALRLIGFLLSEQTQRDFAGETFEYSITDDAALGDVAPDVPLDQLEDLPGTLELLREVGLI